MKHFLILFALLFSVSASARNYKCVTPDGKTVFQEIPCQGASRAESAQNDDHVPIEERVAAEQRRQDAQAQVRSLDWQAEERKSANERQEIRLRQEDHERRLKDLEQRQQEEERRISSSDSEADQLSGKGKGYKYDGSGHKISHDEWERRQAAERAGHHSSEWWWGNGK